MVYWIRELELHSTVIGMICGLFFFTMQDDFVYCNNIKGLLSEMGLPEQNPDKWRLFIDSYKRSLKCVLLYNGNKFACAPIGHSVIVKEHYPNVKMVLQKLHHSEHNWAIRVDYEAVNCLLGQQGGYTKHPCVFSVTRTVALLISTG